MCWQATPKFVSHAEFGNIHAGAEKEILAALPQKLTALGIEQLGFNYLQGALRDGFMPNTTIWNSACCIKVT